VVFAFFERISKNPEFTSKSYKILSRILENKENLFFNSQDFFLFMTYHFGNNDINRKKYFVIAL